MQKFAVQFYMTAIHPKRLVLSLGMVMALWLIWPTLVVGTQDPVQKELQDHVADMATGWKSL